jgi:hypothetical protein
MVTGRGRPKQTHEGALAERVFYSAFVVGGLTEIYETQAEILRLLGEYLNNK